MAEEMVTITATRLAELVRNETKFDVLTTVLFDAAYSYSGEYLSFNDDPIRTILKAYFPNSYQKKLDELKKAKEEKEKGE